MDTSILVEELIENGTQLLKHLLNNKWKVTAAFWNKDEESKEWKLYLCIPYLNTEGARSIYLRITTKIKNFNSDFILDVDDLKLINSKSNIARFIKDVIRKEPTTKSGLTKTIYLTGDEDPQIVGQTVCYRLNNVK